MSPWDRADVTPDHPQKFIEDIDLSKPNTNKAIEHFDRATTMDRNPHLPFQARPGYELDTARKLLQKLQLVTEQNEDLFDVDQDFPGTVYVEHNNRDYVRGYRHAMPHQPGRDATSNPMALLNLPFHTQQFPATMLPHRGLIYAQNRHTLSRLFTRVVQELLKSTGFSSTGGGFISAIVPDNQLIALAMEITEAVPWLFSVHNRRTGRSTTHPNAVCVTVLWLNERYVSLGDSINRLERERLSVESTLFQRHDQLATITRFLRTRTVIRPVHKDNLPVLFKADDGGRYSTTSRLVICDPLNDPLYNKDLSTHLDESDDLQGVCQMLSDITQREVDKFTHIGTETRTGEADRAQIMLSTLRRPENENQFADGAETFYQGVLDRQTVTGKGKGKQ